MKKLDDFLLSVIIPAYKQERTIVSDLKRIKTALGKSGWNWEMIVVVDGDLDRTYRRAKKLQSTKLRVYKYKDNQGKGFAVQFGMKKAKGDYVSFIDSGMEIDPMDLMMLLNHLLWYDADIICGSKRHPVSQVNYPAVRRILSWSYFKIVRLLFGLKLTDTQAGIKVFRKEVLADILPVLLSKKYAFDIEMLSVAHAFGHQRIYNAPIKLDYDFASSSSISFLRTSWNMLVDTLAIFYRLRLRRYYQRQRRSVKAKSR